MKRTVLSLVAGAGLLALVPTAAMAHTDVSIGFDLGGYAPAPYYVEPAPVYYGPTPYYGAPVVYRERERYGWHHRHERQEHRWHEERRWHEEGRGHGGHGWHGHDDYRR